MSRFIQIVFCFFFLSIFVGKEVYSFHASDLFEMVEKEVETDKEKEKEKENKEEMESVKSIYASYLNNLIQVKHNFHLHPELIRDAFVRIDLPPPKFSDCISRK